MLHWVKKNVFHGQMSEKYLILKNTLYPKKKKKGNFTCDVSKDVSCLSTLKIWKIFQTKKYRNFF